MSTKIVPISDLRRQASRVIQMVRDGKEVVYITQHGRPAAVVINFEQYEALLAENETLKQSKVTYPTQEENETFLKLGDMAEDLGAEDLAEQHDHYLYGVDKS